MEIHLSFPIKLVCHVTSYLHTYIFAFWGQIWSGQKRVGRIFDEGRFEVNKHKVFLKDLLRQ